MSKVYCDTLTNMKVRGVLLSARRYKRDAASQFPQISCSAQDNITLLLEEGILNNGCQHHDINQPNRRTGLIIRNGTQDFYSVNVDLFL